MTNNLTKALSQSVSIYELRDKLMILHGDSVFAFAVRYAAKNNIKVCLRMIKDQWLDNPRLVSEIVGEELVKEVLNFQL